MTTPLPPSRPVWLVLAYRLAPGSSLRSLVRQRLTEAGALYLASAVAAVPASPAAGRLLGRLRDMITEAGGSARAMETDALADEADLADACRWAREQEHGETLGYAEPEEPNEGHWVA